MDVAIGVGTKIGIGFGAISIASIEGWNRAEVNGDVFDIFGDADLGAVFVGGASCGVVDGFLGLIGGEVGETADVRSVIFMIIIEIGEIARRSKKVVPAAAGPLFAPHVSPIFVEVTLASTA